MITKFKCDWCENDDPNKAKEYDGMLGYGAIVCTGCGCYYDHTGFHLADEWSKDYAGVTKDLQETKQVTSNLTTYLERRKADKEKADRYDGETWSKSLDDLKEVTHLDREQHKKNFKNKYQKGDE